MPLLLQRLIALVLVLAGCLSGFAGLYLGQSITVGEDVTTFERAQAQLISPSDQVTFQEVDLPHMWPRSGAGIVAAEYRFTFDLEGPVQDPWALLLPNVVMTPAVTLNGRFAGGVKTPRHPFPRHWNRPSFFDLQPSAFRTGTNELVITVHALPGWGRISAVHLGPKSALAGSYQNLFFIKGVYPLATTFLCLFLSIGTLVIAQVTRRPVYFWFFAFSLTMAIFVIHTQIRTPPVPDAIWDFGIYFTLGLMVATGTIFTHRFLGITNVVMERIAIAFSSLGATLLVLFALVGTDGLFYEVGTLVWTALVILLGSYPMFLALRAAILQPTTAGIALSVCYVAIVLLGVHDWLFINGLLFQHDGLMTQNAIAPLVLAISTVLVQTFMRAVRETEQLNATLERRIDEKSAEIEAAYSELNERTRASALLAERERIMRDMHDGVGGSLIGALSRLRSQHPDDKVLADELSHALDDLRLMIDSLDTASGELSYILGMFRNRMHPKLDDAQIELLWDVKNLPAQIEIGPERNLHLLRILQELITNAIKHSRATQLTFKASMARGNTAVDLEFCDNGIGLPADPIHGRGLKNIQSRSDAAEFKLKVESGATGTRTRLHVPLNDDPH